MTAKNCLTADELRSVLIYDSVSGEFSWTKYPRKGLSLRRGNHAGYLDPFGYVIIRVNRIPFKAHRLAWLWMTGAWPDNELDHINHNRSDNRWTNLRQVTAKQNNENRLPSKKNKSGVCGVHWHPRDQRWQASIVHNYRRYHLGTFDVLQDAIDARHAGERKHFTHSQLS